MSELLNEGETVQSSLKLFNAPKTIVQLSRKFVEQMQKVNADSATKLITNNVQNGVPPLTETTLKLLKQKHPEEVLLPDKPEVFIKSNSKISILIQIRKAVLKTKGDSGPSGMDADGWKWILTSKQFAESCTDLCTTIANLIKKLCVEKDLVNTLETFLSCHLIPLDKNPGLRPIGVGEVLRRIVRKVIVSTLQDDIITSVGSLQICTGQESECDAAVHAMH